VARKHTICIKYILGQTPLPFWHKTFIIQANNPPRGAHTHTRRQMETDVGSAGESQLWLWTTQPPQLLTGLTALTALTTGLWETSMGLPAPARTQRAPGKAEMPGPQQAKACSLVQGSQLWAWQPPGWFIIPIRPTVSPLWAVPQCQ